MNKQWHVRSIQKTGRSTFIVSLPRKWVLNHGLERGSKVLLEFLDDGSLRVKPYLEEEKPILQENRVVLEIESGEDTSIERLLIAYYEAGYDVITINQRPYLSEELRKEVRRALLRLSGLEVVEESSDKLLLQVIIDESQIPIKKTLERMENIVRSMLADLKKSVIENNAKILESIVERDNELDKFYFFLGRQAVLAIKGKRSSLNMGLEDVVLVLPYKTYGKCLEEMGDTLVSVTRYVLSKNELLKERDSKMLEILNYLEKSFEWAIRAFREKSEEAIKTISNLYTSFFLSFEQYLYKPDVIILLASRFLSLCIDIIEAHIERRALIGH
ncbi:MAG: phosphate uptake regulator PhoU [Thermoproteales archaeon]|nr:phosphate uptake regulator PhoU [Thermoproteales archaeon]